ncbi:MAG: glutathionylspermidine synthase family protein [Acidobacteria bacterium]|nr:glutathionylspermidine synthase family protein [Acidobacteriota bacterium]
MIRHNLAPRPNWQAIVEEQGLTFHSTEDLAAEGATYWDESACYEFTADEVDTLEATANEMQQLCLAAAQHIIDNKRYVELEIPEVAVPLIEWAWNEEPPALYGRFDFMYNGSGPAKLLEYNADTPTSLLEAAVIQWQWLEDQYPQADQFNSIHERLIAKWKGIAPYLSKPIYFASVDTEEDLLTATYLRDTAEQAGLPTQQLLMEEIGWDEERQRFVDLEERIIFSLFKLYPWETMLSEEFGAAALEIYRDMKWIEPIWKMLLSNKGILPILWELNPGHPNLLECYFDTPHGMQSYIKKPLLSREGANISLVTPQGRTDLDGPYGGGRFVYQQLAPQAKFTNAKGQDRYPVLGLWMIDQECGGMGIRESAGPITDNLSSFVPHFFK